MYSLLRKSKKFMTKGKAKELLKYTINLDSNLRQSIAAKRATIDTEDGEGLEEEASNEEGLDSKNADEPDSGPGQKWSPMPVIEERITPMHSQQENSQLNFKSSAITAPSKKNGEVSAGEFLRNFQHGRLQNQSSL